MISRHSFDVCGKSVSELKAALLRAAVLKDGAGDLTMWLCWDCVAPYMVMPLVGGASCGESDWTKPRLSMRLGGERQRGGWGGGERRRGEER